MEKEYAKLKCFLTKELNRGAEEVLNKIEMDETLKHIDPPNGMLNKLMNRIQDSDRKSSEKIKVGRNKKMYLLVVLVAALSMGIETTCVEEAPIVIGIREQLFGDRNSFILS